MPGFSAASTTPAFLDLPVSLLVLQFHQLLFTALFSPLLDSPTFHATPFLFLDSAPLQHSEDMYKTNSVTNKKGMGWPLFKNKVHGGLNTCKPVNMVNVIINKNEFPFK